MEENINFCAVFIKTFGPQRSCRISVKMLVSLGNIHKMFQASWGLWSSVFLPEAFLKKRADKLTICYNQITLFSYVVKQILNTNARVMML